FVRLPILSTIRQLLPAATLRYENHLPPLSAFRFLMRRQFRRNDTRNDTRRENPLGFSLKEPPGARSKTVVPPNVSPHLLSSKTYAGRLTALPSIRGPAPEE